MNDIETWMEAIESELPCPNGLEPGEESATLQVNLGGVHFRVLTNSIPRWGKNSFLPPVEYVGYMQEIKWLEGEFVFLALPPINITEIAGKKVHIWFHEGNGRYNTFHASIIKLEVNFDETMKRTIRRRNCKLPYDEGVIVRCEYSSIGSAHWSPGFDDCKPDAIIEGK